MTTRQRMHRGTTLAAIMLSLSLLFSGCLVTPAVDEAPPEEGVAEEGLMAEEAVPPVQLTIPDLDLDVPVTPMGWRVTEVEGVRSTKWSLPQTEAGWHVNSAGAGGQGNVVISGHQAQGEAIFAQIALGELTPEQEIMLADESGRTFTYRVTEVTEPIPLVGATEAEIALANSYIAPSPEAKLTLLTGWPADTTTHYLIVVADLVSTEQADSE